LLIFIETHPNCNCGDSVKQKACGCNPAVPKLPGLNSWKQRAGGSLLGLVGFMLSPLSWWNDLFVNVPLAVGFGWLIGLLYEPAFETSVVLGYWFTNVIGFVLLHKGAQRALSHKAPRPYARSDLFRDILISLAYTGLILILVKLGVIQPIADYLAKD
jgi:hypothetical protein